MFCFAGCCKDHGKRLGEDEALCEEVYTDACQHSGSCAENPNPQVERRDGTGDEGSHKGHDDYEQTGWVGICSTVWCCVAL